MSWRSPQVAESIYFPPQMPRRLYPEILEGHPASWHHSFCERLLERDSSSIGGTLLSPSLPRSLRRRSLSVNSVLEEAATTGYRLSSLSSNSFSDFFTNLSPSSSSTNLSTDVDNIVRDEISDVLMTELLTSDYESSATPMTCSRISQLVLQRVRAALILNGKVVVQIFISAAGGDQPDPIAAISCQCLWNPSTDHLVSVNFQTASLSAVCTLFFIKED